MGNVLLQGGLFSYPISFCVDSQQEDARYVAGVLGIKHGNRRRFAPQFLAQM